MTPTTPVDADLPPLPMPITNMLVGDDWEDVFTTNQLRAAQREAIAHHIACNAASGWVMVPREMTPDMIAAFRDNSGARNTWDCILAATPQPAAPAPMAQEGETLTPGRGGWAVFNSGGACVVEGVDALTAADFLTPNRLTRGWSMVCVAKTQDEVDEAAACKPHGEAMKLAAEAKKTLATRLQANAPALGDPWDSGTYIEVSDLIDRLAALASVAPAASKPSAEVVGEGLREAAKDVIETMEKYPHAIPHSLFTALNNLACALAPPATMTEPAKEIDVDEVMRLADEMADAAYNEACNNDFGSGLSAARSALHAALTRKDQA